MDPLAAELVDLSPYNYVLGNPIKYTDPDGRWPIETIWDIGNVIYDVGAAIVDHIKGDHDSAKGHWVDAGADFGAVVIPYVPAGASKLRHADEVVDIVDDYADEVVEQVVKNGGDAKKAAKSDIAEELNAPATDKIYKRPNNATTPAQRKSVQGKPCATCGKDKGQKNVADHKKELVKEHYQTGGIDKKRMKELDAVQPQCIPCSTKQGGKASAYSKMMKKILLGE